MLTKNFKKAETILSIFDDLYGNEEKEYSVSTFKNGRENGFTLRNLDSKDFPEIAFSENRNSDEIVVYPVHLNQADWDNAKYFKHNDYMQAVKYIHKYLN